jgi:hypothetical protein
VCHRGSHRGTTLVVVLAFGDLTDEAVTRGLWRGASHVHLRAVDEDPGELSRHLVGGVDPLVLEQQVGELGQQLALSAGRERTVRGVCVQHRLTSFRTGGRVVVPLHLQAHGLA